MEQHREYHFQKMCKLLIILNSTTRMFGVPGEMGIKCRYGLTDFDRSCKNDTAYFISFPIIKGRSQ